MERYLSDKQKAKRKAAQNSKITKKCLLIDQYLKPFVLNKNSCCDICAEELLQAGFFPEMSIEEVSKKIQLSTSWLLRSCMQLSLAVTMSLNGPFVTYMQYLIQDVLKDIEDSMQKWGKITGGVLIFIVDSFVENVPEEEQERYRFSE